MQTQQRAKLEDYTEYNAATDTVRTREAELRQSLERRAAIESEMSTATPAVRTSRYPEWRQEYEQLDRQEPLLREKIQDAQSELEHVRGQLSLRICADQRPVFGVQIKRALRAVKELTAANAELVRLRNELEAAGVISASIPYCLVGGVDAMIYENWVTNNFPELKN